MSVRRVALFSPGWPPSDFANGIVTYVDHLRRGLAELGVEAKVLALTGAEEGGGAVPVTGALARRGMMMNLATSALWRLAPNLTGNLLLGLEAEAALRQLRQDWPFEVVEMEETEGLARWVAAASRIPLVVRLHGPWFVNGPVRGITEDAAFVDRVRREGRAIARATGISAPSRDVLDRTRSHYQLDLPEAVVIPNPGPALDARSVWRVSDADRDHVLFVGRFDRHKGGDLVLEAFARLHERRPSARLTFAGPDDGFVDDSGRRWSLPEYVDGKLPASVRPSLSLLGRLKPAQLATLRQHASLVVCASRYETFGLTIVEALAQGCPVVCSDAGACVEIVHHDHNGLLFRSGDAESLSFAIEALLNDPVRTARLAEQGLASYGARYGASVVAKITLEFYSRVISSRHERTRARTQSRNISR